jgi:hypothetical protein
LIPGSLPQEQATPVNLYVGEVVAPGAVMTSETRSPGFPQSTKFNVVLLPLDVNAATLPEL